MCRVQWVLWLDMCVLCCGSMFAYLRLTFITATILRIINQTLKHLSCNVRWFIRSSRCCQNAIKSSAYHGFHLYNTHDISAFSTTLLHSCQHSSGRNRIDQFLFRSLLFPTLFHFFKHQYHPYINEYAYVDVCARACVCATLLFHIFVRKTRLCAWTFYYTNVNKVNIITFCHCIVQNMVNS